MNPGNGAYNVWLWTPPGTTTRSERMTPRSRHDQASAGGPFGRSLTCEMRPCLAAIARTGLRRKSYRPLRSRILYG
jgi:hypothetical protein